MAFCIYCGAKLSETDRFCGSCGARVTDDEPVSVAPVKEDTATAVIPAAPAVEEIPAVEEAAAPVVEEIPAAEEVTAVTAPEEPVPQEPLYAAPITREHVRNSATPSAAQPMPFGNKSARGSSANYSYATAERVNNPVQNRNVRAPRKFLAAFFSVLLCIALLVAMLPGYVLLTVRNTFTAETVVAAVKRVDLDKIPASIIDEEDRSLRGLSFAEALCDALNESFAMEIPNWEDLTPKTLNAIVDESAFLPFIADHAEAIFKAILQGKDSYRISAKDVLKVLEQDAKMLTAVLGIEIENQDLDQLSDDIMEEFELDDLLLPDHDELEREERQAIEILNLLLVSVWPIAGIGLTILLLVLLLFAANAKDPMYAVRDLGIVSVLGTVFPLLAALGAKGAVSFCAGGAPEVYLASVIVSCVLDSTFVVVASVFVAGIVLLIVNGIVRKVQNKKAMA